MPSDFRTLANLQTSLCSCCVGDLPHVVFRFALPDDGGLVARGGLEVAVEAVDGHVELAVLEPGVLNLARGGVPHVFAADRGLLEPLQRGGLFEPELVRLFDRALIHLLVLLGVDVGPLYDLGGGRERPRFSHERVNRYWLVLFSHRRCSYCPKFKGQIKANRQAIVNCCIRLNGVKSCWLPLGKVRLLERWLAVSFAWGLSVGRFAFHSKLASRRASGPRIL